MNQPSDRKSLNRWIFPRFICTVYLDPFLSKRGETVNMLFPGILVILPTQSIINLPFIEK
jgi:hypothetical protein